MRKPCPACQGTGKDPAEVPHDPECLELRQKGYDVSCDCLSAKPPCRVCGGTGQKGRAAGHTTKV